MHVSFLLASESFWTQHSKPYSGIETNGLSWTGVLISPLGPVATTETLAQSWWFFLLWLIFKFFKKTQFNKIKNTYFCIFKTYVKYKSHIFNLGFSASDEDQASGDSASGFESKHHHLPDTWQNLSWSPWAVAPLSIKWRWKNTCPKGLHWRSNELI